MTVAVTVIGVRSKYWRAKVTGFPMQRIIFAALTVVLLPLASLAQSPAPAPTPPAAAPKSPEAPKSYVPGVEQFMGVILSQHAKLWYAGKARNWELAEFELGEIKEVMGDIQDLVPVFKNLPFADMLDAVIVKEIADLEKAIASKNFKKFSAGYDKLTQACNACHEGTEMGMVVIQRPTRPAFFNQDFRPRKK